MDFLLLLLRWHQISNAHGVFEFPENSFLQTIQNMSQDWLFVHFSETLPLLQEKDHQNQIISLDVYKSIR